MWGRVKTACEAVLALHLLHREPRIAHIFHHHSRNQFDKVGGVLVLLGIGVPNFDGIVAFLGTNGESVDDVLGLEHDGVEHRGDGIFYEDGPRVLLDHGDTVGAAIDVFVIFPQGGNGIAHEEEHPVGQGGFS